MYDVTNPLVPMMEITPASALVTLQHGQREPGPMAVETQERSLKMWSEDVRGSCNHGCDLAWWPPDDPGIQSTTAQVNVQVKPEPPVIMNGQIIYQSVIVNMYYV